MNNDPNFKAKVAEELQKLDANAAKPSPTPLDEEGLRRQQPPFHSDADKVKEYHSYLSLRAIEICNFCDWRNPNFPVEKRESIKYNGKSDSDIETELRDPSIYGSYSAKLETRFSRYRAARDHGWNADRVWNSMNSLTDDKLAEYERKYQRELRFRGEKK